MKNEAAFTCRLLAVTLAALSIVTILHAYSMTLVHKKDLYVSDAIGAVVGHLGWAGLFAWFARQVWGGRRIRGALILLVINGTMMLIAAVLILGLHLGYVAGKLTIACEIAYGCLWLIAVINSVRAIQAYSELKSTP